MFNLKLDKDKDQYFSLFQNQCQALTLLYYKVCEVSRMVSCLFYTLFSRRIHICEIKCHCEKTIDVVKCICVTKLPGNTMIKLQSQVHKLFYNSTAEIRKGSILVVASS